MEPRVSARAPAIRPAGADRATAAAPAPGARRATPPRAAPVASSGTAPERMVTVRSPLYEYRFSTRGASLNAATLLRFESYVQKDGSVQLVPRSARDVLAHRVVVGRDTLDFRNVTFTPSADRIDLREGDQPKQLRFVSTNPGPVRAEVTYTFRPDGYLVDVQGRFTGAPARRAAGDGAGHRPGAARRAGPRQRARAGVRGVGPREDPPHPHPQGAGGGHHRRAAGVGRHQGPLLPDRPHQPRYRALQRGW